MTESSHELTATNHSTGHIALYGVAFWLAYLANLVLVAGNTLIFRFSEYVVELGGSAADAGFIIGVGTGISVVLRVWMGRVVDRSGPRWMWIASSVALVLSSAAFIPLQSLGIGIYAIRTVYACGLAGAFSCAVIHVCTGVPPEKRTELIGTLGTSGFVGAVIGPQLGDWIFQSELLYENRFLCMFAIAAGMHAAYLLLIAFLTRRTVRPAAHEPAPLLRLLIKHWPGTLAAVAMMMGMALTVPATFLTLFREQQQLEGIGKFFWFYAPTAIVMRLAGRRWPEQIGRRNAALLGLMCLMASMLLYLVVDSEWELAWPALAAGTGQALLFPAVTTLGAESFPEFYRGTGTTVILGFVDLGALCGAPALGLLIDHFGFRVTFLVAAATIMMVTFAFMISGIVERNVLSEPASVATEDSLP